MARHVVGQLKTRVIVAGMNTPHDTCPLQHREVAVPTRRWNVIAVEQCWCRKRRPGRAQGLYQTPTPGRVPLALRVQRPLDLAINVVHGLGRRAAQPENVTMVRVP